MISRLCKNSKQREKLSKELIVIINQSVAKSEIMEYLKKLQSKKWENRLRLMEMLTKMKASRCIHSKIENLLKNSQNKEKTAEDLLSILKTSKTEREIIAELDDLQNKNNNLL